MSSNENFNNALTTFLASAQEKVDTFYKGEARLTTTVGRRYVRVVRVLYGNQQSAHCFVDRTTGDVLKASSWKAPAKGARGNIFNDDHGMGAVTPLGAVCWG